MSSSDLQPDDARTEELVAYLDGELPDAAARRVEQLLATDDDYRRQLGELDQAWSALESLPTPTVDDRFARTTIEMVALAAQKDLTHRTAAETADARQRMLKFAAFGLALVVASFAAARMLLPSQNRALVADLPAVARIDELTQIGDIDFLRGLTQLDIQQFNSDDDSRTRSPELEIPPGGWDNPDSRRSWVEHLSADQKAELAGRLQRFQSLPGGPEEQRRMRQLEAEIVGAPDSALLQRTLAAYGQWINVRSQGEQVALREGTTAARLKQVGEELTRQANRESAHKLSSDEEQSLREAINKFAEQHRSEMLEELRRDNPDAPRRAENEPKRTNMMVVWLAMRDEKLRDELHSQMTAALSESNRQYLEHLSQFDQMWQIQRWMRAAMNPKFGPQELERFFSEKLTNDQREKLLNLPQAKMETQLDQWYTASQLGIPERDWLESGNAGRFGRGGPGAGPGGRPPRDRDDRPRGRGEGPPREFGPRGFDRGPGPGRPPMDGPPPGGPPPRDGRDRPAPPPDDEAPPSSDSPPRNG
jgi:hypothetical protein